MTPQYPLSNVTLSTAKTLKEPPHDINSHQKYKRTLQTPPQKAQKWTKLLGMVNSLRDWQKDGYPPVREI